MENVIISQIQRDILLVIKGRNYPCGKRDHLSNSRGNLDEHKRAVHEEIKYPCGNCGHLSTSKGYLAEHKRAVHVHC